MKTLHLRKSIGLQPFWRGFALIAFGLAWFALSPTVPAVTPAPDGCYPNFTTAEGCNALSSLTTGSGNTGLGWFALLSDSSGSFNTGVGAGALTLNNADSNTAVGAAALLLNTSGSNNTAVGTDALVNNTSGISNTANGAQALLSNNTGSYNTAIGNAALQNNTTALMVSGSYNTATGDHALYNNTNGLYNTANGQSALYNNISGSQNTANGISALWSNTTGGDNTANGGGALYLNTTGSFNTANGFEALHNNNGDSNTANGYHALYSNVDGVLNTANGLGALANNTTGGYNTALGYAAGSNVSMASNVICIGANVLGGDVSNTTWMASVYGVTTQSGTTAPVVVSDGGQLGTVASSERFKKDIATMEKASEAILALRPVTFHYKADAKGTPQFGLIAEEVAKVNPTLVLLDKDGKPYTVRYDQVNAMLLNEFLKEHRKVEKLEATVAQQHKDFEAAVAELKGQIQKVNAQLELDKHAPQTVSNNH